MGLGQWAWVLLVEVLHILTTALNTRGFKPGGSGTSGRSPPWCRRQGCWWSAQPTTQPWCQFETLKTNKKGSLLNWIILRKNFWMLFFNLSTGPTISFHGLRAEPTCFALALNWGSCRTWTNWEGFYQAQILRELQNLNNLRGELSDTKEPSNLVEELRYFWSCDIGEVHGPANSWSRLFLASKHSFVAKFVAKLTQFLNLFSIRKLVVTDWSRNLNKTYSSQHFAPHVLGTFTQWPFTMGVLLYYRKL